MATGDAVAQNSGVSGAKFEGASATSQPQAQFDVIRRYATLIAILAAGAEVLLLICGLYNFRLSVALAFPILIGIICGVSKGDISRAANSRDYLHPVQSGLAGGAALVGVGLHSTAGVVIAVVAVLTFLRFPLPSSRNFVVGLAAISPWTTECIADGRGTGSILLGSVVCAVAVLTWIRSQNVETLVVAFCLSTLVYVTAAVVLFLLGFRADYNSAYLTDAIANYGPFTLRWRFPLAVSWVTVPTVAALGSVLCVWVVRLKRSSIGIGAVGIKAVCAVGIFVHLLAVLAADGRTQIVAASLGVIIASGLMPRIIRSLLLVAAAFLWLAPLWWSRFADVAEKLVVDYLPMRGTAARTATLQGRTTIWDISLDDFGNSSFMEQLSGWGPDGYIASGTAAQYSGVLGVVYRSGYYPPHNALLEVLLSGGIALMVLVLVGIAFLVFMQLKVQRFGSEPAPAGVAALGVALGVVAFPEVAVLCSNASAAALGPMVTLICLTAYSQTINAARR
ncbi:O-antigen ligase family protein [Mycolicibacterium parafortuitum]|uniref:Uncharacterized protein n=1 Tax=Mycolicibacterium parafortuitum TaxID=39692 RepID=A0A375YHN5_MYCPF|nr:O-antigen ligase family protein [Mycolicibacterium parafortuitum]SRX80628.1 hypothetical protein MPP7335_02372 [Mycolicibacterium parafortuitum]